MLSAAGCGARGAAGAATGACAVEAATAAGSAGAARSLAAREQPAQSGNAGRPPPPRPPPTSHLAQKKKTPKIHQKNRATSNRMDFARPPGRARAAKTPEPNENKMAPGLGRGASNEGVRPPGAARGGQIDTDLTSFCFLLNPKSASTPKTFLRARARVCARWDWSGGRPHRERAASAAGARGRQEGRSLAEEGQTRAG